MNCWNAAAFPCHWGQWRENGWNAGVKRHDSSNAAYLQDGNSDPEKSLTGARSHPSKHLETWNQRLLPRRLWIIQVVRICQLQNCSSCLLTMNSSITPVDFVYRSRFLYCFLYWSIDWQDKAQLYNLKAGIKCWPVLRSGPWKSLVQKAIWISSLSDQRPLSAITSERK